MPREKRIPTNPRFDFVTKTAYDFLLECGYSRFPISPFDVLKQLEDYLECLPWSEAKKILKSDDPFHLRQQKAEARTIRMRGDGRYWIVYDDVTVNSDERISWTIMHEIGHILLGHLVDFGETALDRGGLTSEKYGVLEVEAHYFAAEFLMPTALLKYFSDITVDEISLLFGVSEPAAQKKYDRVFKATYLPASEYDQKLIRNFYDFLDRGIEDTIYHNIYRMWGIPWKSKYVPLCRKCPECYSYISDPKAIYCPHCGFRLDQKRQYRTMFERLGAQQKLTQMPGISHIDLPYNELDDSDHPKKRLIACPNCLNPEISMDAEFCNICGQPLINTCTRDHSPLYPTECYCPTCGSMSAFNRIYPATEKRIQQVESQKQVPDDWALYPHWGYVRMRLGWNRIAAPTDLRMALVFTTAYTDDDDNLIIFADSRHSAILIRENAKIILQQAYETDSITHEKLEVFLSE